MEREILPSLMSMIFALTFWPTLRYVRGSSTSDQSISRDVDEAFETVLDLDEHAEVHDAGDRAFDFVADGVFAGRSFPCPCSPGLFSEKMSLPSFGLAVMMVTEILLPTSFFSSSRILSLSPSARADNDRASAAMQAGTRRCPAIR